MLFGGGAFERELIHEGGALMSGISAPRGKQMLSLSAMRGYRKKALVCKPGGDRSWRNESNLIFTQLRDEQTFCHTAALHPPNSIVRGDTVIPKK